MLLNLLLLFSSRRRRKYDEQEMIASQMGHSMMVLDHLKQLVIDYDSCRSKYQSLVNELGLLQNTAMYQGYSLSVITTAQNLVKEEINSCRKWFDNPSKPSFNGVFIWKITDVQQKISKPSIENLFIKEFTCLNQYTLDDAEVERQRSIYSSIFYSSSSGYKMCSRLFLNGVNTPKDTHLSIFFILMRHEYDAILTWPFPFRVIFTLIDQSIDENGSHHHSDSFWPDPTSNCFQHPHPQLEMSEAYGIEEFFPLNQLKQHNHARYILNDTMFIKIEIDFVSQSPSKTVLIIISCRNQGSIWVPGSEPNM